MVDYNIQAGSTAIRPEVVDSMVKQVAKADYKFKQAVAQVSTNAWNNTFFRESREIAAGKGHNTTANIPRGANFPQYSVKWEEVSVKIVKYGLEDNIPWEDILSNAINVQARTIIGLTQGVVKAVDDGIWDALTESNGTGTNLRIQSFIIGVTNNNGNWNQTSASILDDLMKASQKIKENGHYDTSNLLCYVNPQGKRDMMNYFADKGNQWMPIATDIAQNGRLGKAAGITIIESESVAVSRALVLKPKTCATWKSLVPLKSVTIVDPFKSTTIRVVEEGVVELTDPLAVCLIKGTLP